MFSFLFSALFFLFLFWLFSRLWMFYRIFSNVRRKVEEASQKSNAYHYTRKGPNQRRYYQYTTSTQAPHTDKARQEKDISHRVRIIEEEANRNSE